MAECPEIVVYQLHKFPVSGARQYAPYIARLFRDGDFLPMVFSGRTSDEAEACASQFWATETAKVEARRAHMVYAKQTRLRRVKEGSA